MGGHAAATGTTTPPPPPASEDVVARARPQDGLRPPARPPARPPPPLDNDFASRLFFSRAVTCKRNMGANQQEAKFHEFEATWRCTNSKIHTCRLLNRRVPPCFRHQSKPVALHNEEASGHNTYYVGTRPTLLRILATCISCTH